MFDEYDKERFSKIHNRHQVLTTFVVGPMMLMEVVSGCLLFDAELFLAQPSMARFGISFARCLGVDGILADAMSF